MALYQLGGEPLVGYELLAIAESVVSKAADQRNALYYFVAAAADEWLDSSVRSTIAKALAPRLGAEQKVREAFVSLLGKLPEKDWLVRDQVVAALLPFVSESAEVRSAVLADLVESHSVSCPRGGWPE